MVGMLITMVCIAVLFAIMASAMNKATTGAGSVLKGTVRSFEDKNYLSGLYMAMASASVDSREPYIVPSNVADSSDRGLNTTANLFSAMLMNNYTVPAQLISGNEYSVNVWEDEDYDFTAYDPRGGVYWDTSFKADLDTRSNVSFAHLPLYGERFEKRWQRTFSSNFPLIGNRGPQAGVHNPNSDTYGDNEQWAGHVVYGDGHVEFIETFLPSRVFYDDFGERVPDNIFAMEQGPDGGDAILSFTLRMGPNGPLLQHD